MKVLYISYDGMTDNLGSAQVIPYLEKLALAGHEIAVLSFEKADNFRRRRKAIQENFQACRIQWFPLKYHKWPPVFSTLYDLFVMNRQANRLNRQLQFETVHCRSYIPSLIGLRLKRRFGVKFIFDMRGFWADERVDGDLWNQKNPLYRCIYRFFKKKERQFLQHADQIVSLTQKGKEEMLRWPISEGFSAAELDAKIKIIPCCVDLEHFSKRKVAKDDVEKFLSLLKLEKTDFVVTYLGSIGTWYLIDEMAIFFSKLKKVYPNAKFLIITPESKTTVIQNVCPQVHEEDLRVISASRQDIPALLTLTHLGLFFIKPSYSKMSSSATKLAEMLAMEIPVITNSGVGDHEAIFSRYHLGHVVSAFTEKEFERAAQSVGALLKIESSEIRAAASDLFSLDNGVKSYLEIYQQLLLCKDSNLTFEKSNKWRR